jgi:uncharacterized protein DUF998
VSSSGADVLSGLITLLGVGVCSVTLVVLHFLPTGLSLFANPVSQYGITRFRVGYRIQTISMGVSAVAAAIGIKEIDIPGSTLVMALLLLSGASRCVISWFPMDSPDSILTKTGRRHGVLAIIAFASATIAAIHLGGILENANVWRNTSGAIFGIGIEMLVSLFAMGIVRHQGKARGYFGLAERAFYLGAVAFLVLVGAGLIWAH